MNGSDSGGGRKKSYLSRVDHILLAAPDLQEGVEFVEERLGIRASTGGSHIGLGTRNALLALGPATYLEIIAPDPEQTTYRKPRLLGIDDLTAPKLAAWVAKADDLEQLASKELSGGLRLGEVLSGSRLNPDGVELTWRFTDPFTVIAGGTIPFFIDWGQSPHPAAQAAPGASLVSLRAEHPEPEHVRALLDQLGLNLPVSKGPKAALVATIECPKGIVELR
jgi:hypothetical protein